MIVRDGVEKPDKECAYSREEFTDNDQGAAGLISVGYPAPDKGLEKHIQHHRECGKESSFGYTQAEIEPQIYRKITVEETAPEHR